MANLTKMQHSLYKKLCDEYINNRLEFICSLQSFLKTKAKTALKANKGILFLDITAILEYAENDF